MGCFNRQALDAANCSDEQSRIMDTVQRQIASYRQSLDTMRQLRTDAAQDQGLRDRIGTSPESMATLLVERGIPIFLAVGMAGEEYADPNFGTALAIWTWDCCCTACCCTNCCIYTSFNLPAAREPIALDACFGRPINGGTP